MKEPRITAAEVDERAVEVEEDDWELHRSIVGNAREVQPHDGAVARPRCARPSSSGARSTPSTIVPTIVRTMCRRRSRP
jgi:hypothetical protein